MLATCSPKSGGYTTSSGGQPTPTVGQTKMNVVIVDYGAGNLRSVERAVAKLGGSAQIASDPATVVQADALILPGVGAAADTMRNLRERGLDLALSQQIAAGVPFLGICMGMQVLLDLSEEGGEHHCLGLKAGRVVRFQSPNLKIPQIGWNEVWPTANDHYLFAGIAPGSYFYFVHSYYAQPEDGSLVVASSNYGGSFAAAMAWDNVAAVQFHPEKSSTAGLQLIANWLRFAAGASLRQPASVPTAALV